MQPAVGVGRKTGNDEFGIDREEGIRLANRAVVARKYPLKVHDKRRQDCCNLSDWAASSFR